MGSHEGQTLLYGLVADKGSEASVLCICGTLCGYRYDLGLDDVVNSLSPGSVGGVAIVGDLQVYLNPDIARMDSTTGSSLFTQIKTLYFGMR